MKCCSRQIVEVLPDNIFSVACSGCNKIIYGLIDEDSRQIILKDNSQGVDDEMV
jgi:hypothetical protein